MSGAPANIGTYQSSADASSHTITFGFTPTAGSLLLAAFAPSSSTVLTFPTGWTVGPNSAPYTVSRVSDGTETSVTLIFNGSVACVGTVLNYVGVHYKTAANTNATGTTETATFPASIVGQDIEIGFWRQTTASPFAANTETNGFTEVANLSTAGGSAANMVAATKVTATSGETCVITAPSSTPIFSSATVLTTSVTPKFICGAECGIAAVGTLSAGTEHWSTVTGTPTVVTSGPSPMRSTRAFRFNTGFPSMTHLFAAAIASPATAVARFYVYFTSLPAADYTLFQFSGGTTVSGSVRFVASGATLRARAVNTNAASGIAVTTGVWYRVDIKSVNAATQTCDISVDGTAGAQASVASTAQTVLGFQVGDSGVTAPDHYIDDLIVSGTSADYPIGAGTVVGLYPNGDRTNSVASGAGNNGHQFSATTDFGKGTGGATATGAQNVESTSWQSLDNPLTTTASGSWVSNLLGSVGEILVWTMDDLPADATSVNGVMLVATTHSAAATANDFGSLSPFSTGGSQVTPLPITGDMSETTITVPVALMPLGPASAAWTVANVNSCNTAWGSSSDVNPDVYLDGFCWEVDYVPTPPVTGVPPARRDVRQAIQRGSFY